MEDGETRGVTIYTYNVQENTSYGTVHEDRRRKDVWTFGPRGHGTTALRCGGLEESEVDVDQAHDQPRALI